MYGLLISKTSVNESPIYSSALVNIVCVLRISLQIIASCCSFGVVAFE